MRSVGSASVFGGPEAERVREYENQQAVRLVNRELKEMENQVLVW